MIKACTNKPHDNGSIPASPDNNKTKERSKEPFTNMSIKSHFWTSVLYYTRNNIISSSVFNKLFHRFLLIASLKYINYSFNFFFFKRLNMIYCTAYKEGSTELKNKLYCMYRSNAAVWSGEQCQVESSSQSSAGFCNNCFSVCPSPPQFQHNHVHMDLTVCIKWLNMYMLNKLLPGVSFCKTTFLWML